MGHGHGEAIVGVIDGRAVGVREGLAVGVREGEVLTPVAVELGVGVAAKELAASANAVAASEITMKMVANRRLMRPTPP
ncbi:MAG: hypothetical protein DCC49_06280 [Acidobacteria bacterium]|nr:MAG: hypothetical protein DCC49_06280 [Acidobacteriota bacterium]